MKYIIQYLVLAILSVLHLTSTAQTINLVSGDDYVPYADRNLPEGGLITDIVKKAFSEVKKDVTIQWQPWARGYSKTKEGHFDATFPYLKNKEREEEMLYSDIVFRLQDHAFIRKDSSVNKGNKLDFSNLNSLTGTIICLPLGWSANAKMNELLKADKIKQVNPKDITACVKMIEAGRADYFITDESQGLAAVKANNGNIIMDPVLITDNSLYLVVSKRLPNGKSLIDTFNKGLLAIKTNGIYDKTLKSHLK